MVSTQSHYTLHTFIDENFLGESCSRQMNYVDLEVDATIFATEFICTVTPPRTNTTACEGDQGGPLMYKDREGRYFLAGIFVTPTDPCMDTRSIAISLNIFYKRDLIYMRSEPCFRDFYRG